MLTLLSLLDIPSPADKITLMRFSWLIPLSFLLPVLSSVTPVFAADEDTQIWSSITAIVPLTEKIDLTIEGHSRLTEHSSVHGQRFLRPQITYKLKDNLSLTVGHFYGLMNSSSNPSFIEQRIWEQVGYNFLKKEDGTKFSGRTRLEQRTVNGASGTGWRFRQQLRYEAPFQEGQRLRGVIWDEIFFNFNDVSWGPRSGVDQNRVFLGINLPVYKNLEVEPGYINQYVVRSGSDNVVHVLSVNFIARF